MSNAVLVCNYGGIIRIREVPEKEEGVEEPEEGQLVTMEQMEQFGFVITEEGLEELNRLLEEFGVTERESIACFLATCAHESMNGTKLMEAGTEEYFEEHDYSSEERGAGYIQLTGDTQEKFYTEYLEMDEGDMPENRVEDIANNYAWLSAVWEWAGNKMGDGVIMNDYVNEHGGSEGIFLVTQYFINGYLSKTYYPNFDGDLSTIKEGNTYEYDWDEKWTDGKGDEYVGTLHINGRVYRLPVNYKDRLEKYKLAMEVFCGRVIE